jgi:hypothetical protein
MHGPRAVAEKYVQMATADAKGGLAELFAPDALFHAPDGNIYHGQEEIAAFYRHHLATIVPTFHIHRAVVEDNDCWIELADGPTDHPTLLATNHFTVGHDTLITRLAVYLRPRRTGGSRT